MPHSAAKRTKSRSPRTEAPIARRGVRKVSRHTVALDPQVANDVERYAAATDASMSKAIAALVRLGLENQERRKREFFAKLKHNLANDDPKQQDHLVDDCRPLILGR